MGKNGQQTWCRESLPVGTIRVRKHSQRVSRRMIKVSSEGPKGRRWITLARHWWLTNRGSIPAGLRVVHIDGNPLNDSPDNYGLVSAGDVAFLAREWDPDLDEKNARAVAKATASCNRDRARVRQAISWLPTRWYAVDLHGRRIVNRPYRSRLQLARQVTGLPLYGPIGYGLAGLWLGWPGETQTAACLLAVLAEVDGRWLESLELVERLEGLRTLHGWSRVPLAAGSIWTNGTHPLNKRGLIVVWRRGRKPACYRITDRGLAMRQPEVPWVACRGSEIADRFGDYAKVWPEQLAGEESEATASASCVGRDLNTC